MAANRREIVEGFNWSPSNFIAAIALSFVGLVSVAGSWAVLQEQGIRRRSFHRYLLIQPAKHIPGGIAHPIGLISSSSEDTTVARSTTTFLRHSMVLLAGGLALGVLLVADPDTRWIGIGTTASSVAVWMLAGNSSVVGRFERWLSRFLDRKKQGSPPNKTSSSKISSSQLLAALFLAAIGIGGLAAGFAALAPSFEVGVATPHLIGTFGVAWSIGFALFPFPAGLGVRESVLVGLLASGTPGGTILAVAVLQRLSQLVAEGAGVALGVSLEARHRRTTPTQHL